MPPTCAWAKCLIAIGFQTRLVLFFCALIGTVGKEWVCVLEGRRFDSCCQHKRPCWWAVCKYLCKLSVNREHALALMEVPGSNLSNFFIHKKKATTFYNKGPIIVNQGFWEFCERIKTTDSWIVYFFGHIVWDKANKTQFRKFQEFCLDLHAGVGIRRSWSCFEALDE